MSLTPEQAGAVLTVDLKRIAENRRAVQARVGAQTRVAAVLKTDAYGLGAEKVAKALYDTGCRDFFTAYGFEGAALRAVLPPDAKIYALHGVLPDTEADFAKNNLIPVLSTPDQIRRWDAFAKRGGVVLPAAVHVDTGMTRLGLTESDVDALCANVPENLKIGLVISHLACADDPENRKSEDQLNRFDALCAKLRAALPEPFEQSLSATDGANLSDPRFYKDVVRLGHDLYNGAVSLRAKILQIQDAAVGQTVGYGATRTFDKPAKIATLAIGYGDGYSRALANRGFVWIAGCKAPVVGRISMDLTTVDVTDVPAAALAKAETAEIYGEHCPLKEIAKIAGTIDYELLTNLGGRFYRVYTD